MRTKAQIEAQIRVDNPTSDGKGAGHPDYEALVAEWTNAAYQQELEQPPVEVTKLSIMRRLQELGKWAAFKSAMASLPDEAQDAWTLALSVKSDDPIFLQYGDSLKNALGLTDEQFAALLQ